MIGRRPLVGRGAGAVEGTTTDLQRAPLLEAQVEIAIAPGDVDQARSAAEELDLIADRLESKALVASAAHARGRCGSPTATRPV